MVSEPISLFFHTSGLYLPNPTQSVNMTTYSIFSLPFTREKPSVFGKNPNLMVSLSWGSYVSFDSRQVSGIKSYQSTHLNAQDSGGWILSHRPFDPTS